MSTADPEAASCSLNMPQAPAADADLRKAYNHLRFVAEQMWTQHRTGFPSKYAGPDDYPYTDYPFTGLGWTYNWNAEHPTHVGVSKFVIPSKTKLTLVGPPISAETCCAASK